MRHFLLVVLVGLFTLGMCGAAVAAPPQASFVIAPDPVVVAEAAVFTNTSFCNRTPCVYEWTDPDDGQVFSTSSVGFAFTFRSLGMHRMALTVTDRFQRASTVTQSFDVVRVTPDPEPTPTPTPSPTPSPTPTPGLNCMPNPSACGYPDLETVGVEPGVTLTPVTGIVTLSTPGMVYENRLVVGQIRVAASNVTIRNVKLVATDGYYGIWSPNSYTGTLIDHVEIDHQGRLGDPGGGDFYGIAFDNYTARNVFFHDGSDCAGVADNTVIEDSLCAVGPDANDDGWPDGGAPHPGDPADPNSEVAWCNSGPQHFDGFQSDRGNGMTIRHNTIRNACSQTSAILMSSNTMPLSNIRIENNLMAGGAYTVFCGGSNDPSRVTNEIVTGNRIARTYWTPNTATEGGGYYGPFGYCGTGFADVFTGNVFDDTGEAIGR